MFSRSRERIYYFFVCSFFSLKDVRKMPGCLRACADCSVTFWRGAVMELGI